MYNYTQKTTNVMKELNILLSKTLSMFRYEGLPDSIPQRELERQLQTKGYAFITEFKGKLYSFTDGLGGEPDPYGNPTKITIANPALKYNATLDLEKDGVLIRGDSMMNGLRYLLEKYITMMNENEVTMMVNSFNARMPALISAGDDKTRESAEQFLQRIVNGEMGVIAENRLFDGIKVHSNSGVGSFTQLIEYQQYLKATLYNELGLEMNNNMKRERLTQDEVNMTDIIYPFIDNMLTNREMGIEQVNKKYGKEITIGLDSIWAKHTPNDAWDDEEFYAELDEYLQLLLSQEGAPQPMGEPVEEPVEEDVLPGVSEEELMDMLEQLKAISEDDEDVDRESGHPDGDSAGSVTDDGEGFGVAPESGGDSGTVSGDYGDDSEPDGDNTGEDKGTSGGDTEPDSPEAGTTDATDDSGDGTTTDEPVGDDDSSNTSGDGDTNESGSDDGRRIVGDIQTNETRIELVVSRELTGDADSGTYSEAELSDGDESSEGETTGTSDWAGSSLSDETETTTGDAGSYIEIHVEAEDVIVEAVVEEAVSEEDEEKEEGDEDDES